MLEMHEPFLGEPLTSREQQAVGEVLARRRLTDLTLSNIDLVYSPANEHALVALMKAKTVTVAKLDEPKKRAWGWASIAVDKAGNEVVDSQGDVIDVGALEEASVHFMLDHRATGVNHDGRPPVGRVFEAIYMSQEKAQAMQLPPGPVPTGLWIGVQVDDDATWKRVQAGSLSAFSVEGKAVAESLAKSAPVEVEVAEVDRAELIRRAAMTEADHRAERFADRDRAETAHEAAHRQRTEAQARLVELEKQLREASR